MVRVVSACVICTLAHLGIILFFYSSSIFFFRSSYFLGGVFFCYALGALVPITLALDFLCLTVTAEFVSI